MLNSCFAVLQSSHDIAFSVKQHGSRSSNAFSTTKNNTETASFSFDNVQQDHVSSSSTSLVVNNNVRTANETVFIVHVSCNNSSSAVDNNIKTINNAITIAQQNLFSSNSMSSVINNNIRTINNATTPAQQYQVSFSNTFSSFNNNNLKTTNTHVNKPIVKDSTSCDTSCNENLLDESQVMFGMLPQLEDSTLQLVLENTSVPPDGPTVLDEGLPDVEASSVDTAGMAVRHGYLPINAPTVCKNPNNNETAKETSKLTDSITDQISYVTQCQPNNIKMNFQDTACITSQSDMKVSEFESIRSSAVTPTQKLHNSTRHYSSSRDMVLLSDNLSNQKIYGYDINTTLKDATRYSRSCTDKSCSNYNTVLIYSSVMNKPSSSYNTTNTLHDRTFKTIASSMDSQKVRNRIFRNDVYLQLKHLSNRNELGAKSGQVCSSKNSTEAFDETETESVVDDNLIQSDDDRSLCQVSVGAENQVPCSMEDDDLESLCTSHETKLKNEANVSKVNEILYNSYISKISNRFVGKTSQFDNCINQISHTFVSADESTLPNNCIDQVSHKLMNASEMHKITIKDFFNMKCSAVKRIPLNDYSVKGTKDMCDIDIIKKSIDDNNVAKIFNNDINVINKNVNNAMLHFSANEAANATCKKLTTLLHNEMLLNEMIDGHTAGEAQHLQSLDDVDESMDLRQLTNINNNNMDTYKTNKKNSRDSLTFPHNSEIDSKLPAKNFHPYGNISSKLVQDGDTHVSTADATVQVDDSCFSTQWKKKEIGVQSAAINLSQSINQSVSQPKSPALSQLTNPIILKQHHPHSILSNFDSFLSASVDLCKCDVCQSLLTCLQHFRNLFFTNPKHYNATDIQYQQIIDPSFERKGIYDGKNDDELKYGGEKLVESIVSATHSIPVDDKLVLLTSQHPFCEKQVTNLQQYNERNTSHVNGCNKQNTHHVHECNDQITCNVHGHNEGNTYCVNESNNEKIRHINEFNIKKTCHVNECNEENTHHVNESSEESPRINEGNKKNNRHVYDCNVYGHKEKNACLVYECNDKKICQVNKFIDENTCHVIESNEENTCHANECNEENAFHLNECNKENTRHVTCNKENNFHVNECNNGNNCFVKERIEKNTFHVTEHNEENTRYVNEPLFHGTDETENYDNTDEFAYFQPNASTHKNKNVNIPLTDTRVVNDKHVLNDTQVVNDKQAVNAKQVFSDLEKTVIVTYELLKTNKTMSKPFLLTTDMSLTMQPTTDIPSTTITPHTPLAVSTSLEPFIAKEPVILQTMDKSCSMQRTNESLVPLNPVELAKSSQLAASLTNMEAQFKKRRRGRPPKNPNSKSRQCINLHKNIKAAANLDELSVNSNEDKKMYEQIDKLEGVRKLNNNSKKLKALLRKSSIRKQRKKNLLNKLEKHSEHNNGNNKIQTRLRNRNHLISRDHINCFKAPSLVTSKLKGGAANLTNSINVNKKINFNNECLKSSTINTEDSILSMNATREISEKYLMNGVSEINTECTPSSRTTSKLISILKRTSSKHVNFVKMKYQKAGLFSDFYKGNEGR